MFLKDILASARKILNYVGSKSHKDFVRDQMMTDAVIRNLEIIGEAVKKIPANVKQKHPEIEWKKIACLRDILIHEYFGIDYDILWDIVRNKIPQLKEQILLVLKSNR
ncbi:MAG: DUF86 domain-containing protein [Planctomycetota bacterium]|nr:DUF86 domain-containing protein [Planctomycetota bacterium]